MATETIELGPTPCDEPCAQTTDDDYVIVTQVQCKVWKTQLYRFLEHRGFPAEKLPESFRLIVKAFPHDFGNYYEVVVKFSDNDEKAWDIANMLESECPIHWDEPAKAELAKALNQ